MTEIEHVTATGSHGPVAIFLTDEGRVGFVCRRDKAYWEGDMPQLTAPSAEQGRSDLGGGLTDRLTGDDATATLDRPRLDLGVDRREALVPMEVARQIAIEHLRG